MTKRELSKIRNEVRRKLGRRRPRSDGITATPLAFFLTAKLVEDLEYPDSCVFEVQQEGVTQASILLPGERVRIHITFWFRLAYNPKTKELIDLPEAKPRTVKIEWIEVPEFVAGKNFSYQPVGRGLMLCKAWCFNQQWRTANFEGVERRLKGMIKKHSFKDIAKQLAELTKTKSNLKREQRLREVFLKGLVGDARRKWNNYMKDPVENADVDWASRASFSDSAPSFNPQIHPDLH